LLLLLLVLLLLLLTLLLLNIPLSPFGVAVWLWPAVAVHVN